MRAMAIDPNNERASLNALGNYTQSLQYMTESWL